MSMKIPCICFLSLISLLSGSKTNDVSDDRYPMTNVDIPSFCGPSCLTVFLKMAGIDASMNNVCELAGKDSAGTSLEGLQTAARAKGIYTTGLYVTDTRALKKTGYDAIVLLKSGNNKTGHFVLVTGFDGDKAKIINPPYTPYLRPMQELDKRMEGSVLLLSTSPIVLSVKEYSHIMPIFTLATILIVLFAIWLRMRMRSRFVT